MKRIVESISFAATGCRLKFKDEQAYGDEIIKSEKDATCLWDPHPDLVAATQALASLLPSLVDLDEDQVSDCRITKVHFKDWQDDPSFILGVTRRLSNGKAFNFNTPIQFLKNYDQEESARGKLEAVQREALEYLGHKRSVRQLEMNFEEKGEKASISEQEESDRLVASLQEGR